MTEKEALWGVTIEYDLTVKATTQELAESRAKIAHELLTHRDGYITGSWKTDE